MRKRKRLSPKDAYAMRCLDYGSEQEAEREASSKLWDDLATWAFAETPEIPSELTTAAAETLLDKAARAVKQLRTVASWKSAARYFEAENFHALTGPACMRAMRLENKPAPRRRKTAIKRRSR